MVRKLLTSSALFALTLALGVARAQDPPPQQPPAQAPVFQPVPKAEAQTPKRTPAAPQKRVVEEIVARVNNEIVTLTDMRHAQESMMQELESDCQQQGCSAQDRQQKAADREKNLLRDLIDQQLLVQRAKDLNINVEADVVKRLDDIRIKNNIATMEELQKQVEGSGLDWEDFKNNIRSQLLTQELMQTEIGRTVSQSIDKADIQKYYEEHKQEFERPEAVCLSEIFVSTVDKPESELPALEAKIKLLRQRIVTGEDFYEFAKRYSDGDTAKERQGELGCFERGKLSKEIEDVVFAKKKGELTDIIRTKTGFLFLKVEQRYETGIQPLEKVEREIQQRLYYTKMQPQLRVYLAKLRSESYLVIKPGYTDTAAVESTPIVEVEKKAGADDNKKDKKGKEKKEKKKDTK